MIIAQTGKQIIKTPAKRYSREDIQHACLKAGFQGRFRGTDEDGGCWSYDDFDGWQQWEQEDAPTMAKTIENMTVKELSTILQNKQSKVGLTRIKSVWTFILGPNEYKGKSLSEVLSRALWDA